MDEGNFRVYFALDPKTREVKIGKAKCPSVRVASLATSNPRLLLIGECDGDESEFHGRFANLRVSREFFSLKNDLFVFLKEQFPDFEEWPTIEFPASGERCLTPPQLARRWRCKPESILALIRAGRLAAFSVSPRTCRRPRWKIAPEVIAAYEMGFFGKNNVKLSRRRKDPMVIDFF